MVPCFHWGHEVEETCYYHLCCAAAPHGLVYPLFHNYLIFLSWNFPICLPSGILQVSGSALTA